MTSSSVGTELRKYSALAWAIVTTLIISIGLFIQFLTIDHKRALNAFASSAEHASTITGLRINMLINQIDTIGRDYLLTGASDTQLQRLMRALDVDMAHVSLCAIDGDSVNVLHTAQWPSTTVYNRCAKEFIASKFSVSHSIHDGVATDLRLIPSPSGDSSLLEFIVHDDTDHELRLTLNSTALLAPVSLQNAGIAIDSESICLSLRTAGTYQKLACHTGESVAAIPETFTSVENNLMLLANDIETRGLHWRLVSIPHAQSLAGAITLLPFIMFGIALTIGAVISVLAFQAADKNIRLEARAEELRTRLQQVGQLKEQNSMLDQFAAMAAHDLQAPLRFMVSNAHLLVIGLNELNQPDLTNMAKSQIEQGDRMRRLILDLLEFCRAGQSRLTTTMVDTRTLVKSEIQLLQSHAEFRDTDIIVGPLPKELNCDADKLSHILRNLLGNAVKFSQVSEVPKVTISASRESFHGRWTFKIRDNGPGIEKAHHERIFRPFARLDADSEGTGMGLAIVKIMVERHGGAIWIDSDNTEGCTFCFTMPGTSPEDTSE